MTAPPMPRDDAASAPFWAATRERRLIAQRCDACAAFVWYPRAVCPGCLTDDLQWVELAGRGTVYSVSVHYRAPTPELRDAVPYAVALVDVDEGPRFLTNVVHCDPETVAVGDRVRATWRPLPDGRHVLEFEPDRNPTLADPVVSQ